MHGTVHRKLDPTYAEKLAKKGITQEEIARLLGVHRTTVNRYLNMISPDNQALQEFQKKSPDVRDYIRMVSSDKRIRLLQTMDDKYLEALTPDQKQRHVQTLTVCEAIDTDKSSLERG